MARFFIDRPIFSAVLSIIILVAGAIAIPLLPVSEYPETIPPTVQVTATYPGASPKTISEAIAIPLEEAINGLENMLYMKSVSASDGTLALMVTFKPGTDVDGAQVQVQNRVNQALPRLPDVVRQLGVSTQKRSPTLTMAVNLLSPDGRYDTLYLRNYALLHLKDELSRVQGVGEALLLGAGDYAMRIWLDPSKMAARGLIVSDVLSAIREQNVEVSAGQLGAPPQPTPTALTLQMSVRGRLVSEQEFGQIIVKTGDDGQVTRVADVARVELGASAYALRSILGTQDDGEPHAVESAAIAIFQSPGSNALEMSKGVRSRMEALALNFPPGITYELTYDTTAFVSASIKAVINTLLEAVLLVVLVVILFLQTWRASIIPLIAVPVSIIGSFSVLYLLGFSINTLTLFGLVLAIGIVVDDAIVVVENVERHIALGLAPKAAAYQAMREVSGPIVAIALVLSAVFVPMCFLPGVTGQFYRQFAVAITISTLISAVNSLTLSPALAAVLLKPHDSAPDRVSGWLASGFGWLFRRFNRAFENGSLRYASRVALNARKPSRSLIIYVVLLVATVYAFLSVPGGFIPVQDKLYLLGGVITPEGSSLDRTEVAMRRMNDIAMQTEGVDRALIYPGMNPLQGSNTPNTGSAFFILKDFDSRKRPASEIAQELSQRFSEIPGGFAFAIMPPPILGLGTGSGFSLYLQDREMRGNNELLKAVGAMSGNLAQINGMSYPITAYQANVPQLEVVVDRTRVKEQGVAFGDLFDTLQVYLGSAYVNDFVRFGRTYQVKVQAEASARNDRESIGQLHTRNRHGGMVPLGSMLRLEEIAGPDPVIRYNGYPAADLIGEADQRVLSSNDMMNAVKLTAERVLPKGIGFEWTDLSYQQSTQGKQAFVVFPLSVLLVFLVLAALYESWKLPLAVILIVPMAMLAALLAVSVTGGDNNIFVQIGLVVLMGLACKNAILIVEFARELEKQGRDALAAAVEASRLRLRPIVMTSVAFIAGTAPLLYSSGAGAEVRRVMGITVFGGMVGVTILGLMLTPVLYVFLRGSREREPFVIRPDPKSSDLHV